MKVLITGVTGFLGKTTAIYLKSKGYQVHGIGRNEHVGRELIQQGIVFIPMSLENPQSIHAFDGFEFVIHAAALSSPWGCYDAFYRSNVVGTKHVVNGCCAYGVKRLIHISTPSIYFDFKHQINIKEDAPLPNSVNHYTATKRQAEELVQKSVQNGLEAIILRPRGLFGPGDPSIFPRLIRAVKKGYLPIFGNGRNVVDLTYVVNASHAIFCAMISPKLFNGEVYNITNDDPQSLISLVRKVFDAICMSVKPKKIPFSVGFAVAYLLEQIYQLPLMQNKEPLFTKYTVGTLAFSQTLSIEKAKKELRYQPIVSIDEGIEHFAAWWKKHEVN